MDEKTDVEVLYDWIDRTTEKIERSRNEPYIECLIVTLGILFERRVPTELSDAKDLEEDLSDLSNTYHTVTIRKAVQLAILKGMQGAQEKHLVTPETVALIMGYLAEKLMKDKEAIRIFDPVAGTGNMLTAVLDHLKQDKDVFASEVDPTLIQLAALNANLQKMNIEFFHQDSLDAFLLDPVDLIIADLPVGYYPDKIQAERFSLKSESGLPYTHHLLLEQSVYYTKPGGYLIFVIPSFLFESDQADQLRTFIQDNAHIVGVLQLPDTAFANEKNMKSILILQKKSNHTTSPKQPLLVKMPSFKNATATKDILDQMDAWFERFHAEQS